MQPEDFMQSSRRCYAEWVADFHGNRSGIVLAWFRNRSGICGNPCQIYLGLILLDSMQPGYFMQISPRFQADFTQNELRNRSGIVPESFQNPSASLAESI